MKRYGRRGRRRRQPSDYSIRLKEKQKVRRMYGILEAQFRGYFEKAERQKGVTGEILLSMLERRLDNVVFRMGFASSRRGARQLVRHGHIEVNGRKVNIPSYQVNVGDLIVVRQKSKRITAIKENAASLQGIVPSWLEVDPEELAGRVTKLPTREDIVVPIQEQLIVEYYSR